MDEQQVDTVKTFGGALIGLALLIAGWTIYAGNGYYSSMLFLSGAILIPVGLMVLATALTGGLGQSPWAIVAHYRRRLKDKP